MNYDQLSQLAKQQGLKPWQYEMALMKRCRYWNTCNAVECPLDPLQGQRGPVEEEKCHAQVGTRQRLIAEAEAAGVHIKLKYGGLTKAEWKKRQRSERGKASWAAKPEAEKAAVRKRLEKTQKRVSDQKPTKE